MWLLCDVRGREEWSEWIEKGRLLGRSALGLRNVSWFVEVPWRAWGGVAGDDWSSAWMEKVREEGGRVVGLRAVCLLVGADA